MQPPPTDRTVGLEGQGNNTVDNRGGNRGSKCVKACNRVDEPGPGIGQGPGMLAQALDSGAAMAGAQTIAGQVGIKGQHPRPTRNIQALLQWGQQGMALHTLVLPQRIQLGQLRAQRVHPAQLQVVSLRGFGQGRCPGRLHAQRRGRRPGGID